MTYLNIRNGIFYLGYLYCISFFLCHIKLYSFFSTSFSIHNQICLQFLKTWSRSCKVLMLLNCKFYCSKTFFKKDCGVFRCFLDKLTVHKLQNQCKESGLIYFISLIITVNLHDGEPFLTNIITQVSKLWHHSETYTKPPPTVQL